METKKNKILIITPSIGFGGAEKNLLYISNIISKKFNVDFVILQKRDLNFDKKILNTRINIFQFNFNRTILSFFTLLNLINSNEYKYVLTSSLHLNFYLLIIKYFSDKKFFLIQRESNYPFHQEFNFGYLLSFIFRFLYNFNDKIIVQNKEIKKKLNKFFFIKKKKFFIIKNLIDYKYIKKKSNEKIKLKKTNGQKILINVGSLNKQKNQIEILRALNFLNHLSHKYKMIFIGDGLKINFLKKFVHVNKLKNVFFLGSKKNPYKYIKRSDLFILSSKWEGTPNVLIEAELLRTKIISSDCKTGPSDLKKIGFNIDLYQSGNYIELAKILKKI